MTQPQDGGPAFPPTFGMSGEIGEGMSQRAFAAINLRVPDSGIDWLDAMILQAKRDEFAGQQNVDAWEFPDTQTAARFIGEVAPATGGTEVTIAMWFRVQAKLKYMAADAMIAERNKP